MTNKEGCLPSCLDGDATCDNKPRMAALLAVHLVSQILDEAYVIANAAKETGQPWRNLSMLKSFKTRRLGETDEDSFEASKGDCDLNENKAAIGANVIATSTPQKLSARGSRSDEVGVTPSILHNDNLYIGQGDEDIDAVALNSYGHTGRALLVKSSIFTQLQKQNMNCQSVVSYSKQLLISFKQQNELAKSTSMFINHLFDMSDVERVVICDDTQIIQSSSDPNDLIAEAMNKIMESDVVNSLISLEGFPLVPNVEIIDGVVPEEYSTRDNSKIFLTEPFVADINRDVAFYIEDDNTRKNRDDYVSIDMYEPAVVEEIEEVNSSKLAEESNENVIQENDVALYENAYATLNRDYDQGSEEDRFPILQDPKGMTLQEVELMTTYTSDEEPDDSKIQKEQKTKETVSTVSGASGSRKSTLARRWRIQGARLLACLRGWWRRKSPGKRKESRIAGTVLGMCPLSPDARRRGSSLLDNRLLRSPSPSRPVIWKFNTVSEALVNSNRWKEYTFDPKPEDCGETTEY